jgi:hypothetical protein
MSKFQLDSGKEINSNECLRYDKKNDYPESLGNYYHIPSNEQLKEDDWYSPKYFNTGDYDGSISNLANRQTLLKECADTEGILEVYGSYGHVTLLIRLDILNKNQELQDLIFSLEDYPCLDDELHSELEEEAKQEAWSNTKYDFVRELRKRFDYNFEFLNNDFIHALFSELEEVSNTYWYFEHMIAYFPVDDMLSNLNQKDILESFKEVFHESFNGNVEEIKE